MIDLAETHQAIRAEKEAELVASTPEGEVPPIVSCSNDNAIYMEAVGDVNKKGRVFGLGSVGTQITKKGKTSSSSSSGLPADVVQAIQNLNNELQEEQHQRKLLEERAEANQRRAEEQRAKTRRQLAAQQGLLM